MCNMTLLVRWCHWHYIMPMVPSMASLNSLGHDDWNEVQHDFSGHVIPLASQHLWHHQWQNCLPHVKTIEMRFNSSAMWHHWHWYWHCMIPTVLSIVPLHSLGHDDWNEVQHDILVMWHHWHQCLSHMMLLASASHKTNCIIYGICIL